MGISNSELNFDKVITDLGRCCLTEDLCGSCAKKNCLIGYSKESIVNCFKEKVTYVIDGAENIPTMDTKLYNNEDVIYGIANILKQCKSCKEDHYDNCIINVIRSCYEVILFGEHQNYRGSSLIYLSNIKNLNEEISGKIFEAYNSIK